MFAYSDREITHAAKRLEDDVPPDVKQRRLAELIEAQERLTRASHEARVGLQEEILILGPAQRGDRMVGRTARFQSVLLPLDTGPAGSIVRLHVTASTGHSLVVA
jgi:tRNA-2-methylthio-N6-dimethylallyladenosine synthase